MAAKMQSAAPARKVWIGAIAGAATTLIVWILNLEAILDGQIPAEIAATILTLVSFTISYLVPPAKDDNIIVS